MGRTEIPDLSGLQGEPWLVGTVFFQLERNGAFSKADAEVRSKKNLTPPTLSERLINPSPEDAGGQRDLKSQECEQLPDVLFAVSHGRSSHSPKTSSP